MLPSRSAMIVMAGLVPAIHVLLSLYQGSEDVDARPKAGHDVGENAGEC
jgi:hypothetical protein